MKKSARDFLKLVLKKFGEKAAAEPMPRKLIAEMEAERLWKKANEQLEQERDEKERN